MIRNNDRKYFLPADFEYKYNVKMKRERAKSTLNTANRIFTQNTEANENIYSDNEVEEMSPKRNKSSNFFSHRPQDSMPNIISYKYAPRFRDVVRFFNLIFLRNLRKKLIHQITK